MYCSTFFLKLWQTASIFSVLLGKDAASTLKLAGILYVVGKIGSYFHSATLVYIIILGFFSVPKVYVLKKKEIDEISAIAMEHMNKYYKIIKDLALEKIQMLKPKAKADSEEKKTN